MGGSLIKCFYQSVKHSEKDVKELKDLLAQKEVTVEAIEAKLAALKLLKSGIKVGDWGEKGVSLSYRFVFYEYSRSISLWFKWYQCKA